MWARVVEVMFGCWLAISPFVFRHSEDDAALWWNDLLGAAAIITLALLSYYRPLRYSHLALIGVGFWLVGFGYVNSTPPAAPAYQNEIFVGLMLLMFAIIPNEATQPPEGWRKFQAEQGSRSGTE